MTEPALGPTRSLAGEVQFPPHVFIKFLIFTRSYRQKARKKSIKAEESAEERIIPKRLRKHAKGEITTTTMDYRDGSWALATIIIR